MKSNLKVQEFIRTHANWESLLSAAPYCIKISRDAVEGRDLVMLKYNQYDSDFGNEIVRECRGLILDAHTFDAVCVPFFKFGNLGESYCPDIDWNSCWVGEKIDGSLMKVVLDDDHLLISTNGTIDAFKAPLAAQCGCTATSFGALFLQAVHNAREAYFKGAETSDPLGTSYTWLKSLLKPGITYMFEMTSPFNKVVVPWRETSVWFLGARDNNTLQETYFAEHEFSQVFKTPRVFPMNTAEECNAAAAVLGSDAEGYVVCDKHFNRVKIKSPKYVELHHLANNGVLSFERAVSVVLNNECDELLTYFPEHTDALNAVKNVISEFENNADAAIQRVHEWEKQNGFGTPVAHMFIESGGSKRKMAATFVLSNFDKQLTGLLFAVIDNKFKNCAEWLRDLPLSTAAEMLEKASKGK